MTSVCTAADGLRSRLREATRLLRQPPGPRPQLTRRGAAFDLGLALVHCVFAVDYALDGGDDRPVPPAPPAGSVWIVPPAEPHNAATLVVLGVVVSAALALRRRFPLAVLWTVMGTALLTPDDVPRLTFYALVVAVYGAAAYSPHRVPALVTLPLAVLVVSADVDPLTTVVDSTYVPLLILVPIAVTANGLRTWKLRTDEGRHRLAALEREQAEALQRAVGQERARIARELHDVVTHNVSVMVIQAGAARKVMASDPGEAGEALLAVEASGRSALSELRHVMGLLTADGDGDAPGAAAELAPQPGLDQLGTLAGRLRDSGLAVELAVAGRPRPLPPGVELAAFRVVQEALTNTVKHASGASAAVAVEYAADQLRVEVTDTGGRPGPAAATGSGRGLIGLRERLAVYDGTLHTGWRLTGGYRVEARIPLEAP